MEWECLERARLRYRWSWICPVCQCASGVGQRSVCRGFFTTAGDRPANYIAKWDGATWSALGSGMGGNDLPPVSALAVLGSDLYAGGYFTTAGGSPANYIA